MGENIAEIAGKLSEAGHKMVGDAFYIDGWHNRRFLNDAVKLRELGLVTEHETGDDQYTAYHYEPTPLGLAVRAHLQEQAKEGRS